MARLIHLNGPPRVGHDVVLPQLVAVHDHEPDPALREVAESVGAVFVEIVLAVDGAEHVSRLRDKRPLNDVEAHVQAMLTDRSDDLVARIGVHLAAYVAERPTAVVVDTTGLHEDATYALLCTALSLPSSAPGDGRITPM